MSLVLPNGRFRWNKSSNSQPFLRINYVWDLLCCLWNQFIFHSRIFPLLSAIDWANGHHIITKLECDILTFYIKDNIANTTSLSNVRVDIMLSHHFYGIIECKNIDDDLNNSSVVSMYSYYIILEWNESVINNDILSTYIKYKIDMEHTIMSAPCLTWLSKGQLSILA